MALRVPFLSSAQASLCRAFVGRLGRGNKERARFDGKRKKTDPAVIVFQSLLFSLQHAAGASLEERGVPLYPSLR